MSFRRLTKVGGVTSKFWLKLTDVKRHCRKAEQHKILVNSY